jgi:outer membrane protein TolC
VGCAAGGNKLAANHRGYASNPAHRARSVSQNEVESPETAVSYEPDAQFAEQSPIQTVGHEEDETAYSPPVLTSFTEDDPFDSPAAENEAVPVLRDEPASGPEVMAAPLPEVKVTTVSQYEAAPVPQVVETTTSCPIDLPTALRLAGANNLQIAFAAERVRQARAQADAADALWIPSLRAGMVYNNHAGQIQATEGDVITINRNSLFVGGGAGVGSGPLNGGSGGPARMFVDLSLVDVLFEPLAARQIVRVNRANHTATFNDTLLQTASAYLNLLGAHALVAVSEEAVKNAKELSRLTADFARTGRGLQADADRASAEFQSRQRNLLAVKEQAAVASAELARILRLDPTTELIPAESMPVPLHLVEDTSDVHDLIGLAQAVRPELAAANANVQETCYRVRQEHWRPWVPHLYAGASGGGFGGAPGGSVDNFSGRTDFDLAAIWEVENLGFGNRARRREQQSRHRQTHIARNQIRDLIAAEVTQAIARTESRDQQIGTTELQVRSATNALRLNMDGIRGGVIRPIEIQQAIGALAGARQQYLDAVLEHNRAQFELVRAIGQPPEIATTVPPGENTTE